ncbi:MAG: UDP-3-O-(3-hydroxymyristoyl)glucosamine N-acyltransferase [Candidatus Competibacteraceae bacterium]|nr:UDP-3-O-(3-hydroxymyristoyl)glucosamine N-acyltransferase [Candidatus Competibacteraceae bacterium]
MKFSSPISLSALAEQLSCEYNGDPNFMVTGINEIHVVSPGEVTFVDHPKYYDKALSCPASVVIIDKKVDCPTGKNLLFHPDPFSRFKKIIEDRTTFHPSTQAIHPSAKIGKGTIIQPGVFIGENVIIGDGCLIHANVSIYQNTSIGNSVIIHSNTTIGADAFYMKRRPDSYEKFLTCGTVIIGDDVEIGAGSTIDRGVTSDTIIGDGTKIDNQVHVGHDTHIGKHCIIAAQVGISGIVRIEDYALIWGQVGIDRDLVIGKGAIVLAQSGVSKTLEAGKTYFGSPAGEARDRMKEYVSVKRIPEILKRIDELEKIIAEQRGK